MFESITLDSGKAPRPVLLKRWIKAKTIKKKILFYKNRKIINSFKKKDAAPKKDAGGTINCCFVLFLPFRRSLKSFT